MSKFNLLPSDTVLHFEVTGGYAVVILQPKLDNALLFVIAVDPAMQRRGLGSALLAQVTAWADQTRTNVTLAVVPFQCAPDKRTLEAWYCAHGWQYAPGRDDDRHMIRYHAFADVPANVTT